MATTPQRRDGRRRVRDHRDKMRARGLRPVQFWVPDTRTDRFRDEARRQSLAAANSPFDAEDQAFIDAVSIFNEE